MRNDSLPLKTRIKFYAFKYGIYGIILAFIFAFAFLVGKHIEAVFLFGAFVVVRYKFPKTFHHSSTYWCAFWSIAAFWVCIASVLPIGYSVLASVCIALVLCFVLFKIQDYSDTKNELESRMHEPTIYEMTRDEFNSYCLSHKIRNERVEYVWDLIRGNDSVQELADKYCVEPQTIKQDRWRFKKKFGNSKF